MYVCITIYTLLKILIPLLAASHFFGTIPCFARNSLIFHRVALTKLSLFVIGSLNRDNSRVGLICRTQTRIIYTNDHQWRHMMSA